MSGRTITLGDFLTEAQIKRCSELKQARLICKEVIEPNIAEINRKLGQENHPMYLAYLAEYVIGTVNERRGIP